MSRRTKPLSKMLSHVRCPYCGFTRSVDNLAQTKPRIKCKPCADKKLGFK